jgi:hypothetical protein
VTSPNPVRERLPLPEWWPVAAVALLSVVVYAGSLGHGFTYDDVWIVRDNERLHTLANWRRILTVPWWEDALFRPFTALTLAGDWSLSGGAAPWFHIVNVLLHGGTSVLVYLLARRLLPLVGAVAAGSLFAVHPVHVEAVANVVGRAEVLATLFLLVAVLLYRADGALVEEGHTGWRRWVTSFGTLAALLLALASKEAAFVGPGLLLLIDWYDAWRTDRRLGTTVRRHWVLWWAGVALTAEWLWIWVSVVGSVSGGAEAPGLVGAGLGERAIVMAPVVLEYVRLLVFPARLSADYSPDFLPVAESLTMRGVVGLVVVVGSVVAAVALRRRMPAVTFGVAWVGGALLIVANILVPTEVLLAERTLYLPSVGAVLVLGYLFSVAHQRWSTPAVAVAVLLVGLGTVRTVTRVPIWRDNATFFPQLVRDAPGSFRRFWVEGALRFEAGDSAGGEESLRRAIQVYPLHQGVWSDLAAQMERQRRWGEAGAFYSTAFRLDSTRIVYSALAAANYIRAGMLDSAAVVLERAQQLAPRHPVVLVARSDLAMAQGRPMEAMTLRRQLAWRFPKAWEHWYLTADAAIAAGYCPEAERSLRRLRDLNPEFVKLPDLERRAEELGCTPT